MLGVGLVPQLLRQPPSEPRQEREQDEIAKVEQDNERSAQLFELPVEDRKDRLRQGRGPEKRKDSGRPTRAKAVGEREERTEPEQVLGREHLVGDDESEQDNRA